MGFLEFIECIAQPHCKTIHLRPLWFEQDLLHRVSEVVLEISDVARKLAASPRSIVRDHVVILGQMGSNHRCSHEPRLLKEMRSAGQTLLSTFERCLFRHLLSQSNQ